MRVNLDAEKAAREPRWFTVHPETEDDPAVRVLFAPIGRIALRAARRAAGEVYQGADLPEEEGAALPLDLIEAAGDALSEALLLSGIIQWEGVGDASGEPVPVTDDHLRLFLADPTRFALLDDEYVRPFILKELEKNASAPLPNGILAGATPGRDIARRSAKPKRKAAAKTAPTGRTNRAAKKA